MDAFSWSTSLLALALLGVAALLTWLVSIILRNVSIVDSLWAVMIALAAWVYALAAPQTGPRVTNRKPTVFQMWIPEPFSPGAFPGMPRISHPSTTASLASRT